MIKKSLIALIQNTKLETRHWFKSNRKMIVAVSVFWGIALMAISILFVCVSEETRNMLKLTFIMIIALTGIVLLNRSSSRSISNYNLFRRHIFNTYNHGYSFEVNISNIIIACEKEVKLMPLTHANNQPNIKRIRLEEELARFIAIANRTPNIIRTYLNEPCTKENYAKMYEEYALYQPTEKIDNNNFTEVSEVIDARIRTWALSIILDNILNFKELDKSVKVRFVHAVIGGNILTKASNTNTYKYYGTLHQTNIDNLSETEAKERIGQIDLLLELFKSLRQKNAEIDNEMQKIDNQRTEIKNIFNIEI